MPDRRIKLRSGKVITLTQGLYDPEDGSFGTGGPSPSRPDAYSAWAATVANMSYTEQTLMPFDSEKAAEKAARYWVLSNA